MSKEDEELSKILLQLAKLNEISRIIDDPEQHGRVVEIASEFEDILVNLPEEIKQKGL